ncbi:hypothetical protein E5347_09985 [Clostridium sartagoforme]|uniref:Uncharacterized protein n=1 Tax=Clostridium sartagoforme TaxID=84031 RepID=A0A4S2DIR0_9CLOT|nr:hypothetical protein [Clostridium sartagoforme]TGY42056.1 hypothetical protein E5347_09985 [Clostridium sartagoforme]
MGAMPGMVGITMPANVLVLRITNTTDKIIKNIQFNYDESNMKDVVISTLKPNQNKQVGISTINIKKDSKIKMYNEVDGKTYSYIIRDNSIKSELSKQYMIPTSIYINKVNDNGELEITTKLEE